MGNDKREIYMTEGKLLGKIIRFSIPLMLSGVLQLTFSMADRVVVGRYAGKEALAAVGSCAPLADLFVNLFIGLSIGATVTVSRYFGARDNEGMHRASHTSVALSLICGILIAIIGNILVVPVLKLVNVPEDVFPLALLYVRIIFAGMPFNMLYNFASGIMRSYGDTKRPLYFITIAGIVNVILNLFFVIVLKMSASGVALATIISQAISAILTLLCLTKVNNGCRIYLNKLKIYPKELKTVCQAGIPSGIQGSMFSISNIVIQSALNALGSTAMAAGTASSNFENITYIIGNSVGNAAVTASSQNYGAKKLDRILKSWKICMVYVTIATLVVAGAETLFLTPLLKMFTHDLPTILMAKERFFAIVPWYFICGYMEISVGCMRGLNFYTVPMIVTVLGVCGLRILWVSTIYAFMPSIMTLYVSYPVSWTTTALVQTILFFAILKKRKRLLL